MNFKYLLMNIHRYPWFHVLYISFAITLFWVIGGFNPTQYIPHGVAVHWDKRIILLDTFASIGIAIAYYGVSALLISFAVVRKDIALFRHLFYWFGAFIMASGTTHLIKTITYWYPIYALEATFRTVTASIALIALYQLVRLMPTLLTVPSRAELEEQIAQKEKAYSKLDKLRAELEDRVAKRTEEVGKRTEELNKVNKRLLVQNAQLAQAISVVDELLRDFKDNPSFQKILEVSEKLTSLTKDN